MRGRKLFLRGDQVPEDAFGMIAILRVQLVFVAFVSAVLWLPGCAKTTTTTTTTTLNSRSSAATGGVQVFYSPPTDREYEEIGLVTAQTGQTVFHDRSVDGMIEKMKAEAAKMGADAIIVRSANAGTWGLKGGGNTGFERGNSQAVAIKFK